MKRWFIEYDYHCPDGSIERRSQDRTDKRAAKMLVKHLRSMKHVDAIVVLVQKVTVIHGPWKEVKWTK